MVRFVLCSTAAESYEFCPLELVVLSGCVCVCSLSFAESVGNQDQYLLWGSTKLRGMQGACTNVYFFARIIVRTKCLFIFKVWPPTPPS